MQAFQTSSNPVEQLILCLKRTKEVNLHDRTKPFKVIKAYVEKGVSVDIHAPIHRQFLTVIRHICPEEEEAHILSVAQNTSIQDYINADGSAEELDIMKEKFVQ